MIIGLTDSAIEYHGIMGLVSFDFSVNKTYSNNLNTYVIHDGPNIVHKGKFGACLRECAVLLLYHKQNNLFAKSGAHLSLHPRVAGSLHSTFLPQLLQGATACPPRELLTS